MAEPLRKNVEEIKVDNLRFLATQDGPPEQLLKNKLTEHFQHDRKVVVAYLVQIESGNPPQMGVALCLKTPTGPELDLVKQINEIFSSMFGVKEHLDIMFLDKEREIELENVCRPFFSLPEPAKEKFWTRGINFPMKTISGHGNPRRFLLLTILGDLAVIITIVRLIGVNYLNMGQIPLWTMLFVPAGASLSALTRPRELYAREEASRNLFHSALDVLVFDIRAIGQLYVGFSVVSILVVLLQRAPCFDYKALITAIVCLAVEGAYRRSLWGGRPTFK